jgi:hypothetical protein
MPRSSLLHPVRNFFAVALVALVASAHAADQSALAERLAATADAATIEKDDSGRVVRLALSNHQQHRPGGDKAAVGKPGLTDANLPDLLQLTSLRSLFLEKQALTAAGHARLAELPALEDLRLHYMGDRFTFGYHKLPPIDPGFIAFIDRLPPGLRQLELKHGFDVKGDGGPALAALKPRPRLEKLELDTAYATPAAVPFILGSPALVDLQLHRTTMGDADIQKIFAALPRLRILELRPERNKADPITARTLRGLRDHPALERVYLSMNWGDLPFEDGLDHLASIKTLKLVSLAGAKPAVPTNGPALAAFKKARPDVSINLGKPSDNVNAAVPANTGRDAETTWGITQ